MKAIAKYRLADLTGTIYETTLKGEIYYEYRIRFKKQVVGRNYVYIKNKQDCIEQMSSNMEQIFDCDKLGDFNNEITK